MSIYYIAEERAFAPGIADGWPLIIPAPHTGNGRLRRATEKEAALIDAALAALTSPRDEEALRIARGDEPPHGDGVTRGWIDPDDRRFQPYAVALVECDLCEEQTPGFRWYAKDGSPMTLCEDCHGKSSAWLWDQVPPDVPRMRELRFVRAEMDRAWERFGEGSMGGSEMSRTERFAVLSEEVGEVAREVVKEQRNRSLEPDKHGPFSAQDLINELEQVAACAALWAKAERAALAGLGGVPK